jgi:hypothetical protein
MLKDIFPFHIQPNSGQPAFADDSALPFGI